MSILECLQIGREPFGEVLAYRFSFGLAQAATETLPPTRGVYTPGIDATNSGVLPQPGLTYANMFLDYSYNQFKAARGSTIFQQGEAAVFVDLNILEWVANKKILGANFAAMAVLPISNSSITSVKLGALSSPWWN